jgi:hypothetical protein
LLLVEVGLLDVLLFLHQLLSLCNSGILHALCNRSGLHLCFDILQRSSSGLWRRLSGGDTGRLWFDQARQRNRAAIWMVGETN